MHHYKAKGGTSFNFNSDLSGPLFVEGPPGLPNTGCRAGEAKVPAADVLEFVDWYRRTPGYGKNEDDPT